jgi:hypothetical protein
MPIRKWNGARYSTSVGVHATAPHRRGLRHAALRMAESTGPSEELAMAGLAAGAVCC